MEALPQAGQARPSRLRPPTTLTLGGAQGTGPTGDTSRRPEVPRVIAQGVCLGVGSGGGRREKSALKRSPKELTV